MKTISTLGIILIFTQIGFAQENKLWLSLSSGLSSATASNKSHLIGNGFNIEGSAFVPFYRKGWDGSVKGSKFMLGINVSGNYANLKNLSPDNSNIQNQYNVFAGSLAVASQSDSKISGSFSGLVGLQGRFSFWKFDVAPSLNMGYLSFKKEGYVQTGNTSVNGQNRQIDLVKVDAQSTSGLIFKPQIKVGYSVAPNISLFISPAMLMGHELTHNVQQRVPQGGFNDRQTYDVGQLEKGTLESKTSTSKYNLSELNFGLSVGLGKRKSKTNEKPSGTTSSYAKTVSAGSITPVANNVTDFNTTRNNRERGQLRKDTLFQEWDHVIADNINTINKVDTTIGGGANQRLSMNVTTPKQTQGKTFGESVAVGIQTNTNPLYEDKGKQVNNPLYEKKTVSADGTTPNQEQRGSQFGGRLGGPLPLSKQSESERKRVEVLKSNKTEAAAKPGSLIKGIIVKGGKNPGGNMRLISNDNGEVLLNGLEVGSYSFTIVPAGDVDPINPQPSMPSDIVSKQSENEKRRVEVLKSNKTSKPGSPIKGIIVKGGKNPPVGNFINLTINDKGQIGFEVLEAGDYKLIIQTPEALGTGTKKGKVVEKATSGLKDTLKTNV